MIKQVLFFSFFFGIGFPLFAQVEQQRHKSELTILDQPEWDRMRKDPHANFWTAQQLFNAHWKGETPDTSHVFYKKWSKFKRWEYFMERRAGADGRYHPEQSYKAYQTFSAASSAKRSAGNTYAGEWSEVGPLGNHLTTDINARGTQGRVRDIAFYHTDSNVIYISGREIGLWKTIDHGVHWVSLGDELPYASIAGMDVHPTTSEIIFIVTSDGELKKSLNDGETWQTISLPVQGHDYSDIVVHPTKPNIIIIRANRGTARSTDGGITWSYSRFPTSPSRTNGKIVVDYNHPDTMYVPTLRQVYRTTDAGVSWSILSNSTGATQSSSSKYSAISVSPLNSSRIYLARSDVGKASNANMYYSDDFGTTFTWVGKYWTGDVFSLQCLADPTKIDVVHFGNLSAESKHIDPDSTTLPIPNGLPIHADQHSWEYNPVTKKNYMGHDGGLDRLNSIQLISQWWSIGQTPSTYYHNVIVAETQSLNGNIGSNMCHLFAQDPNNKDRMLVGLQDNGTKWRRIISGNTEPWESIGPNDGTGCRIDPTSTETNYITYYSVQGGFVTRKRFDLTTNGGPQELEKTLIVNPSAAPINQPSPFINNFFLHPSDGNSLFYPTKDVWRVTSRSNGIPSYTNLTNFSITRLVTDIYIPELAADTLFFVNRDSVYRLSGIAGTPSRTALPLTIQNSKERFELITGNPKNAGELFVTVHPKSFSDTTTNQKIYRSIDGGDTWTNITSNYPNIRINALIYDKNRDALLVGADIGIYRWTAGSSSWTLFDDDLPATLVTDFDIFYDPADSRKDVLRAATYGRGVWETPLEGITPCVPVTGYCSAGSNNSNYEWINNTGVGTSGYTSTGTLTSGYSDYTSHEYEMLSGVANQVSMTPGYLGTHYKEYWDIWIDYNKDGDFKDPGEHVYTTPIGSKTNQTVITTITPPAHLSGCTRMRFRMHYYSNYNTDCGNSNYGEVEDFTVRFFPSNSSVQHCSTNSTAQSQWISRVEASVGTVNTSGASGTGYTDFTSTTFQKNNTSTADFWLTPGSSSAAAYWNIWIDFNLDGDFNDANEHAWSSSSLSISNQFLAGINIPNWASGVPRMRIKVSDVYTAAPTPCGTFTSGEVEDYLLDLSGSGTRAEDKSAATLLEQTTIDPDAFRLYPNPTRGTLHLELRDEQWQGSRYTVLNAMGQVVIEGVLAEGTDQVIHLSDELPAGQYTFNLTSNRGAVRTEKITLVE